MQPCPFVCIVLRLRAFAFSFAENCLLQQNTVFRGAGYRVRVQSFRFHGQLDTLYSILETCILPAVPCLLRLDTGYKILAITP